MFPPSFSKVLGFSDHELQFIRENFRSTTAFRHSRVHGAFAADFLLRGEIAAAAAAARRAVKYEPRNRDAWETLLDATRRTDPRAAEVVLREAALAFQRYPDLEAHFVARVSESLRARGQLSEADAEIRRIARKNQVTRVDISVQQAREIVVRAMQTQVLREQVGTYNSVVDGYGPTAGIRFLDEVVGLFVEHLRQLGHGTEALRALHRARERLNVEPGSQLEREIAELERTIRSGAAPGPR